MIEFLVAIIAFAGVLGLLVTIHEFGHFFFAKKAGILCSEFAIGMGPIIYRLKKGETYYSIRAIPIGGFVSMAGEDLNEKLIPLNSSISLQLENNLVTEIILNEHIEGSVKGIVTSYDMYGRDTNELYVELSENGILKKYLIADECYYVLSVKERYPVAPYNRCFESKTIMERFLSIVAGPVMNLILAFFIFLIVGLSVGVPTNENIIGSVNTNTAQQYLKENDEIISINGYEITDWDSVGVAMDITKEQGLAYIPIEILRDGEIERFDIKASIQVNNVGITNINDKENDYNKGVLLGEVAKGNSASAAGLQTNDVLISIGIKFDDEFIYTDVSDWNDIIEVLVGLNNTKVIFKYARLENNTYVEKTSKEVEVFNEDTLEKLGFTPMDYIIGISPTTKFSFFGGIKNGVDLTWSNATMIFTTLTMIVNPSAQIGVSDLSGPVGIFGLVQSYIGAGAVPFLSLIGMLSINLFVVNLLPLPALDGGRLVFLGIEAITRKPVKKEVENMVNTIGMGLLLLLMLYVTFQDLLRF